MSNNAVRYTDPSGNNICDDERGNCFNGNQGRDGDKWRIRSSLQFHITSMCSQRSDCNDNNVTWININARLFGGWGTVRVPFHNDVNYSVPVLDENGVQVKDEQGREKWERRVSGKYTNNPNSLFPWEIVLVLYSEHRSRYSAQSTGWKDAAFGILNVMETRVNSPNWNEPGMYNYLTLLDAAILSDFAIAQIPEPSKYPGMNDEKFHAFAYLTLQWLYQGVGRTDNWEYGFFNHRPGTTCFSIYIEGIKDYCIDD
jgi:hypothetical protein